MQSKSENNGQFSNSVRNTNLLSSFDEVSEYDIRRHYSTSSGANSPRSPRLNEDVQLRNLVVDVPKSNSVESPGNFTARTASTRPSSSLSGIVSQSRRKPFQPSELIGNPFIGESVEKYVEKDSLLRVVMSHRQESNKSMFIGNRLLSAILSVALSSPLIDHIRVVNEFSDDTLSTLTHAFLDFLEYASTKQKIYIRIKGLLKELPSVDKKLSLLLEELVESLIPNSEFLVLLPSSLQKALSNRTKNDKFDIGKEDLGSLLLMEPKWDEVERVLQLLLSECEYLPSGIYKDLVRLGNIVLVRRNILGLYHSISLLSEITSNIMTVDANRILTIVESFDKHLVILNSLSIPEGALSPPIVKVILSSVFARQVLHLLLLDNVEVIHDYIGSFLSVDMTNVSYFKISKLSSLLSLGSLGEDSALPFKNEIDTPDSTCQQLLKRFFATADVPSVFYWFIWSVGGVIDLFVARNALQSVFYSVNKVQATIDTLRVGVQDLGSTEISPQRRLFASDETPSQPPIDDFQLQALERTFEYISQSFSSTSMMLRSHTELESKDESAVEISGDPNTERYWFRILLGSREALSFVQLGQRLTATVMELHAAVRGAKFAQAAAATHQLQLLAHSVRLLLSDQPSYLHVDSESLASTSGHLQRQMKDVTAEYALAEIFKLLLLSVSDGSDHQDVFGDWRALVKVPSNAGAIQAMVNALKSANFTAEQSADRELADDALSSVLNSPFSPVASQKGSSSVKLSDLESRVLFAHQFGELALLLHRGDLEEASARALNVLRGRSRRLTYILPFSFMFQMYLVILLAALNRLYAALEVLNRLNSSDSLNHALHDAEALLQVILENERFCSISILSSRPLQEDLVLSAELEGYGISVAQVRTANALRAALYRAREAATRASQVLDVAVAFSRACVVTGGLAVAERAVQLLAGCNRLLQILQAAEPISSASESGSSSHLESKQEMTRLGDTRLYRILSAFCESLRALALTAILSRRIKALLSMGAIAGTPGRLVSQERFLLGAELNATPRREDGSISTALQHSAAVLQATIDRFMRLLQSSSTLLTIESPQSQAYLELQSRSPARSSPPSNVLRGDLVSTFLDTAPAGVVDEALMHGGVALPPLLQEARAVAAVADAFRALRVDVKAERWAEVLEGAEVRARACEALPPPSNSAFPCPPESLLQPWCALDVDSFVALADHDCTSDCVECTARDFSPNSIFLPWFVPSEVDATAVEDAPEVQEAATVDSYSRQCVQDELLLRDLLQSEQALTAAHARMQKAWVRLLFVLRDHTLLGVPGRVRCTQPRAHQQQSGFASSFRFSSTSTTAGSGAGELLACVLGLARALSLATGWAVPTACVQALRSGWLLALVRECYASSSWKALRALLCLVRTASPDLVSLLDRQLLGEANELLLGQQLQALRESGSVSDFGAIPSTFELSSESFAPQLNVQLAIEHLSSAYDPLLPNSTVIPLDDWASLPLDDTLRHCILPLFGDCGAAEIALAEADTRARGLHALLTGALVHGGPQGDRAAFSLAAVDAQRLCAVISRTNELLLGVEEVGKAEEEQKSLAERLQIVLRQQLAAISTSTTTSSAVTARSVQTRLVEPCSFGIEVLALYLTALRLQELRRLALANQWQAASDALARVTATVAWPPLAADAELWLATVELAEGPQEETVTLVSKGPVLSICAGEVGLWRSVAREMKLQRALTLVLEDTRPRCDPIQLDLAALDTSRLSSALAELKQTLSGRDSSATDSEPSSASLVGVEPLSEGGRIVLRSALFVLALRSLARSRGSPDDESPIFAIRSIFHVLRPLLPDLVVSTLLQELGPSNERVPAEALSVELPEAMHPSAALETELYLKYLIGLSVSLLIARIVLPAPGSTAESERAALSGLESLKDLVEVPSPSHFLCPDSPRPSFTDSLKPSSPSSPRSPLLAATPSPGRSKGDALHRFSNLLTFLAIFIEARADRRSQAPFERAQLAPFVRALRLLPPGILADARDALRLFSPGLRVFPLHNSALTRAAGLEGRPVASLDAAAALCVASWRLDVGLLRAATAMAEHALGVYRPVLAEASPDEDCADSLQLLEEPFIQTHVDTPEEESFRKSRFALLDDQEFLSAARARSALMEMQVVAESVRPAEQVQQLLLRQNSPSEPDFFAQLISGPQLYLLPSRQPQTAAIEYRDALLEAVGALVALRRILQRITARPVTSGLFRAASGSNDDEQNCRDEEEEQESEVTNAEALGQALRFVKQALDRCTEAAVPEHIQDALRSELRVAAATATTAAICRSALLSLEDVLPLLRALRPRDPDDAGVSPDFVGLDGSTPQSMLFVDNSLAVEDGNALSEVIQSVDESLTLLGSEAALHSSALQWLSRLQTTVQSLLRLLSLREFSHNPSRFHSEGELLRCVDALDMLSSQLSLPPRALRPPAALLSLVRATSAALERERDFRGGLAALLKALGPNEALLRALGGIVELPGLSRCLPSHGPVGPGLELQSLQELESKTEASLRLIEVEELEKAMAAAAAAFPRAKAASRALCSAAQAIFEARSYARQLKLKQLREVALRVRREALALPPRLQAEMNLLGGLAISAHRLQSLWASLQGMPTGAGLTKNGVLLIPERAVITDSQEFEFDPYSLMGEGETMATPSESMELDAFLKSFRYSRPEVEAGDAEFRPFPSRALRALEAAALLLERAATAVVESRPGALLAALHCAQLRIPMIPQGQLLPQGLSLTQVVLDSPESHSLDAGFPLLELDLPEAAALPPTAQSALKIAFLAACRVLCARTLQGLLGRRWLRGPVGRREVSLEEVRRARTILEQLLNASSNVVTSATKESAFPSGLLLGSRNRRYFLLEDARLRALELLALAKSPSGAPSSESQWTALNEFLEPLAPLLLTLIDPEKTLPQELLAGEFPSEQQLRARLRAMLTKVEISSETTTGDASTQTVDIGLCQALYELAGVFDEGNERAVAAGLLTVLHRATAPPSASLDPPVEFRNFLGVAVRAPMHHELVSAASRALALPPRAIPARAVLRLAEALANLRFSTNDLYLQLPEPLHLPFSDPRGRTRAPVVTAALLSILRACYDSSSLNSSRVADKANDSSAEQLLLHTVGLNRLFKVLRLDLEDAFFGPNAPVLTDASLAEAIATRAKSGRGLGGLFGALAPALPAFARAFTELALFLGLQRLSEALSHLLAALAEADFEVFYVSHSSYAGKDKTEAPAPLAGVSALEEALAAANSALADVISTSSKEEEEDFVRLECARHARAVARTLRPAAAALDAFVALVLEAQAFSREGDYISAAEVLGALREMSEVFLGLQDSSKELLGGTPPWTQAFAALPASHAEVRLPEEALIYVIAPEPAPDTLRVSPELQARQEAASLFRTSLLAMCGRAARALLPRVARAEDTCNGFLIVRTLELAMSRGGPIFHSSALRLDDIDAVSSSNTSISSSTSGESENWNPLLTNLTAVQTQELQQALEAAAAAAPRTTLRRAKQAISCGSELLSLRYALLNGDDRRADVLCLPGSALASLSREFPLVHAEGARVHVSLRSRTIVQLLPLAYRHLTPVGLPFKYGSSPSHESSGLDVSQIDVDAINDVLVEVRALEPAFLFPTPLARTLALLRAVVALVEALRAREFDDAADIATAIVNSLTAVREADAGGVTLGVVEGDNLLPPAARGAVLLLLLEAFARRSERLSSIALSCMRACARARARALAALSGSAHFLGLVGDQFMLTLPSKALDTGERGFEGETDVRSPEDFAENVEIARAALRDIATISELVLLMRQQLWGPSVGAEFVRALRLLPRFVSIDVDKTGLVYIAQESSEDPRLRQEAEEGRARAAEMLLLLSEPPVPLCQWPCFEQRYCLLGRWIVLTVACSVAPGLIIQSKDLTGNSAVHALTGVVEAIRGGACACGNVLESVIHSSSAADFCGGCETCRKFTLPGVLNQQSARPLESNPLKAHSRHVDSADSALVHSFATELSKEISLLKATRGAVELLSQLLRFFHSPQPGALWDRFYKRVEGADERQSVSGIEHFLAEIKNFFHVHYGRLPEVSAPDSGFSSNLAVGSLSEELLSPLLGFDDASSAGHALLRSSVAAIAAAFEQVRARDFEAAETTVSHARAHFQQALKASGSISGASSGVVISAKVVDDQLADTVWSLLDETLAVLIEATRSGRGASSLQNSLENALSIVDETPAAAGLSVSQHEWCLPAVLKQCSDAISNSLEAASGLTAVDGLRARAQIARTVLESLLQVESAFPAQMEATDAPSAFISYDRTLVARFVRSFGSPTALAEHTIWTDTSSSSSPVSAGRFTKEEMMRLPVPLMARGLCTGVADLASSSPATVLGSTALLPPVRAAQQALRKCREVLEHIHSSIPPSTSLSTESGTSSSSALVAMGLLAEPTTGTDAEQQREWELVADARLQRLITKAESYLEPVALLSSLTATPSTSPATKALSTLLGALAVSGLDSSPTSFEPSESVLKNSVEIILSTLSAAESSEAGDASESTTQALLHCATKALSVLRELLAWTVGASLPPPQLLLLPSLPPSVLDPRGSHAADGLLALLAVAYSLCERRVQWLHRQSLAQFEEELPLLLRRVLGQHLMGPFTRSPADIEHFLPVLEATPMRSDGQEAPEGADDFAAADRDLNVDMQAYVLALNKLVLSTQQTSQQRSVGASPGRRANQGFSPGSLGSQRSAIRELELLAVSHGRDSLLVLEPPCCVPSVVTATVLPAPAPARTSGTREEGVTDVEVIVRRLELPESTILRVDVPSVPLDELYEVLSKGHALSSTLLQLVGRGYSLGSSSSRAGPALHARNTQSLVYLGMLSLLMRRDLPSLMRVVAVLAGVLRDKEGVAALLEAVTAAVAFFSPSELLKESHSEVISRESKQGPVISPQKRASGKALLMRLLDDVLAVADNAFMDSLSSRFNNVFHREDLVDSSSRDQLVVNGEQLLLAVARARERQQIAAKIAEVIQHATNTSSDSGKSEADSFVDLQSLHVLLRAYFLAGGIVTNLSSFDPSANGINSIEDIRNLYTPTFSLQRTLADEEFNSATANIVTNARYRMELVLKGLQILQLARNERISIRTALCMFNEPLSLLNDRKHVENLETLKLVQRSLLHEFAESHSYLRKLLSSRIEKLSQVEAQLKDVINNFGTVPNQIDNLLVAIKDDNIDVAAAFSNGKEILQALELLMEIPLVVRIKNAIAQNIKQGNTERVAHLTFFLKNLAFSIDPSSALESNNPDSSFSAVEKKQQEVYQIFSSPLTNLNDFNTISGIARSQGSVAVYSRDAISQSGSFSISIAQSAGLSDIVQILLLSTTPTSEVLQSVDVDVDMLALKAGRPSAHWFNHDFSNSSVSLVPMLRMPDHMLEQGAGAVSVSIVACVRGSDGWQAICARALHSAATVPALADETLVQIMCAFSGSGISSNAVFSRLIALLHGAVSALHATPQLENRFELFIRLFIENRLKLGNISSESESTIVDMTLPIFNPSPIVTKLIVRLHMTAFERSNNKNNFSVQSILDSINTMEGLLLKKH